MTQLANPNDPEFQDTINAVNMETKSTDYFIGLAITSAMTTHGDENARRLLEDVIPFEELGGRLTTVASDDPHVRQELCRVLVNALDVAVTRALEQRNSLSAREWALGLARALKEVHY